MNHYEREIPNTGTGSAKNNHLFFRAPQPNEEPADGELVRLTKAPRFYKDGSRLAFELIRSAIVRPFLPPIT